MRFTASTLLLLFPITSLAASLTPRADPPPECQEVNLPGVEYGDNKLYCCEALVYAQTIEDTGIYILPLDVIFTFLDFLSQGSAIGRDCKPTTNAKACRDSGNRSACCGKQQLLV